MDSVTAEPAKADNVDTEVKVEKPADTNDKAPTDPAKTDEQPAAKQENGKATIVEAASEKSVSADEPKKPSELKKMDSRKGKSGKVANEVKIPPERRMAQQVVYYFSDFNLRRDKFFSKVLQDNAGWLPLSVLLDCNRIKCLTKSTDTLADAIASSAISFLVLDDSRSKVRRTTALPDFESDDFQKELEKRTVYMRRFSRKLGADSVKCFLESRLGSVEHIQVVKTPGAGLSDKYLVVFADADVAAKAIAAAAADAANPLTHVDRNIVVESFDAYVQRKEARVKQLKEGGAAAFEKRLIHFRGKMPRLDTVRAYIAKFDHADAYVEFRDIGCKEFYVHLNESKAEGSELIKKMKELQKHKKIIIEGREFVVKVLVNAELETYVKNMIDREQRPLDAVLRAIRPPVDNEVKAEVKSETTSKEVSETLPTAEPIDVAKAAVSDASGDKVEADDSPICAMKRSADDVANGETSSKAQKVDAE